MRKLLTDHRDALRAEVLKLVHKEDAMRNTFQVELKKAQIAAGFSCKYIGVTEVDSPRPGQDELWKCIDKIEMEAATSPAVPVIIASVPRSTYKVSRCSHYRGGPPLLDPTFDCQLLIC